MLNLPLDPATIILAITAVGVTLFYLREYNLRKNLQKEGQNLLEKFREKGLETFHDSIQKSQDILGEAELERIKVVADSKFETKKSIEQSKQAIATSQAQLIEFMANLQKRGAEFEQASRVLTEQRISALFERLEEKLSDFLITTGQKTTSSIELELKAARQLIETYKTAQLKLIDENIVAMMEQTLNVVLGRKMSLKDQLELIYEALEKAKIDKFIV